MKRRTFLGSALSCLLVSTVASGAFPRIAQAADTKSIIDARGRRISLAQVPRRIAAISYSAVDIALALGIMPVASTYMTKGRAPDYLLGLTEKMTNIGQRARANLEVLSSVRPDVIIAMRRYTEGHAAQFEKIAPYIALNMELLEESYYEVAQLAALLGQPERGEALNEAFSQLLVDIASQVPAGHQPGPRFQIMWGGDSPFSFYDEATPASIANTLGGTNIMGPEPSNGRFGAEISLEAMLEKDPEVIFVYDSGPERPHESNPVWSMLSAVKNNRVHYVGDAWVESNGPIAREVVLREVAHYFYPEAFPAVDTQAIGRRYIPQTLWQ
ncbi:Fe(3+)-citrate-binding protein YfmC [Carnimonas sp. R-84981]|uniref:ABC transporter substrate-binding protein n=1 Tax=Carnimonas bestiolae TaxID=3402172 RepID=UPI003EDB8686